MTEMTEQQSMPVLRVVAQIDVDIEAHKAIFIEGVRLVGQDLIDAKAQLPNGEWLAFLARHGIGQRTAENHMRLVREALPGTRMAELPYSKAVAMLAIPQEEREAFIEENAVEDMSVRKINELIAQQKSLNALLVEEQQKRIKKETELQEQIRLRTEAQLEADRLRNHPKTVEKVVEKLPEDYEQIKAENRQLKIDLDDAKLDAADARSEAMDANARADEIQQRVQAAGMAIADGDEDAEDAIPELYKFGEICNEFTRKVWIVPSMGDVFAQMDARDKTGWRIFIGGVASWAQRALDAVNGVEAVPVEGAVGRE